MKYEIKSWSAGKLLFTLEGENWKLAFTAAVTAGQKFDEADLSGKDFSDIEVDCKDSSFDNCRFDNCCFDSSRFYNCCFDSSFYSSSFYSSSFYNCRFYNSHFYGSFYNSRFDNCSFYNSRFKNSRFYSSIFDNCRLYSSRFDNSSFADKKITGPRPFFFVGPLGSDQRQLMAVSTEKGIHLVTGCFSGSIDEFCAALKKKHGDNEHGKEYAAAIQMIEAHFEIWKE